MGKRCLLLHFMQPKKGRTYARTSGAEVEKCSAPTALASRASVVLSTAGPYTRCGTPLVAACVAAGTDYVDINGEVPWVRGLIDRFDPLESVPRRVLRRQGGRRPDGSSGRR